MENLTNKEMWIENIEISVLLTIQLPQTIKNSKVIKINKAMRTFIHC